MQGKPLAWRDSVASLSPAYIISYYLISSIQNIRIFRQIFRHCDHKNSVKSASKPKYTQCHKSLCTHYMCLFHKNLWQGFSVFLNRRSCVRIAPGAVNISFLNVKMQSMTRILRVFSPRWKSGHRRFRTVYKTAQNHH
jgi:hypothetical protein